jgi:hypothetical protein
MAFTYAVAVPQKVFPAASEWAVPQVSQGMAAMRKNYCCCQILITKLIIISSMVPQIY